LGRAEGGGARPGPRAVPRGGGRGRGRRDRDGGVRRQERHPEGGGMSDEENKTAPAGTLVRLTGLWRARSGKGLVGRLGLAALIAAHEEWKTRVSGGCP